MVWSPRLRFQFTVILGAMAAWTGLYWGARLGWGPALEANSFALEPLLAVALVASDMGRRNSSVIRTLIGTLSAIAFIISVYWLAEIGGVVGIGLCVIFLVGLPLLLLVPGAATLRRDWGRAIQAGSEVAAARGPSAPPPGAGSVR